MIKNWRVISVRTAITNTKSQTAHAPVGAKGKIISK